MNLPTRLTLMFDGGIYPNPGGVPRFGWQILSDGVVLAEGKGTDETQTVRTNNVAEYLGLKNGLAFLVESKWRGQLVVRGDSQLIIKQMVGEMRCGKEHLLPLLDACHDLLEQTATTKRWQQCHKLEWVPRDKNQSCDKLAQGN